MQLQNFAWRLQHLPSSVSASDGAALLQGSKHSADQSQAPPHHASQPIPSIYQSVQATPAASVIGPPFMGLSQGHPSAVISASAASSQPISTYQSVWATPAPVTVTSTHPPVMGWFQGSPSAAISTSAASSQLFLGFNSLGVSMAGQVNRQCLSAAAAHIPRQPQLPSHGWRRGPATHTLGMPHGPQIDDCYTTISVNGTSVPGIHTTVKVYPPQVGCHTWPWVPYMYWFFFRSFCLNTFLYMDFIVTPLMAHPNLGISLTLTTSNSLLQLPN